MLHLRDRNAREWGELARDIDTFVGSPLHGEFVHYLARWRDSDTRPLVAPDLSKDKDMTAHELAILQGVRLGMSRAIVAFEEMGRIARDAAARSRGRRKES